MQSNISRSYLIPSALGAGLSIRDEDEPVINCFVLDTHYSPTTLEVSELFSNGAVFYGEYILKTDWFGMPGHSAAGFLYSNAQRTALDTNPFLLLQLILAGETPPTKNSAWTATYRVDQTLFVDSENPNRKWTLFADFGITDGDPNPLQWFGNASLVGASPLPNRENDTIGIGYYHIGASSLPLLQIHGISAENGVELFYNAAVTPWFHITPDLQVLDPSQRSTAASLLIGLRARLSF